MISSIALIVTLIAVVALQEWLPSEPVALCGLVIAAAFGLMTWGFHSGTNWCKDLWTSRRTARKGTESAKKQSDRASDDLRSQDSTAPQRDLTTFASGIQTMQDSARLQSIQWKSTELSNHPPVGVLPLELIQPSPEHLQSRPDPLDRPEPRTKRRWISNDTESKITQRGNIKRLSRLLAWKAGMFLQYLKLLTQRTVLPGYVRLSWTCVSVAGI